jgi:hypothetical protein
MAEEDNVMRSWSRLRVAVLAALMVVAAVPAATSAYVGQVASNVTVTGPTGTIQCGQANQFQATVFESNGTRVGQHPVTWSIVSGPVGANDTVNPSSTTTNNNGVASTSVTFGGPAGPRTLRATSDNAFGQIVVDPQGCATPLPVQVTIGTCTSALGITRTGPFDTDTEIQQVGGYITFRLSFGPEFAGKPVIVTRATRGVPFRGWGSFFGATIRIADANGDVYYSFRSRTPAWISVRGFILPSDGDGAAISRACQGRFR